jgi:hypothetical protein
MFLNPCFYSGTVIIMALHRDLMRFRGLDDEWTGCASSPAFAALLYQAVEAAMAGSRPPTSRQEPS